jgi:hypothetical protein
MSDEVDEMSAASRGSHTTEVNMADGKGCKCAAYSESECACNADWTPQEVYDLRAENERLKEAIRRLAEQDATLSVCDGNVTVTMEGTLTDEERRAIRSGIAACEDITYGGEFDQPAADTLKALMERLG